MKRHLAYLMIAVMAFAQTPIQEILRIPVLFTHYGQHKTVQASLNWVQFLENHYHSKSKTKNDTEKDQQLPFAGNDLHIIVGMFGCTEPVAFEYMIPSLKARYLGIHREIKLSHPTLNRHFQPPKS